MAEDCSSGDPEEMPCDDNRLVELAKAGSGGAFARLVECNQDKLFAAMFRHLGCRADAEEAVQQAFVNAFIRLDSFNEESKFSTWIYRVAFNAAMSDRRRKRPTRSSDMDDERGMGEAQIAGEDDPTKSIEQSELQSLLQEALGRLSEDHRAILVLREMDDMAYEEIANVLGITVGTVRSRLSRARTQLRTVVEMLETNIREQLSA